jgi:hypothetical protein
VIGRLGRTGDEETRMPIAEPKGVTGDAIDKDLGESYYKEDRVLEEKLTQEIIDIIGHFIERRFNEGRRPALRDAHAKDTGCVRAIFRVDADLDPALRHGIFQPAKEYVAWIRFSNGNSEVLSERFPDARGMAIKLMGVPGEKLLDDEKQTQDFILADNPVFFIDDLQRYRDTLVVFHSGGYLRQFCAVRKLRFREARLSLKVNLSWIVNPLFSRYWSMTPYRLGASSGPKIAIKYFAKPRLAGAPTLFARWSRYFSPGFSLKGEMNETLSGDEMWFDFYIQRYVDHRTPIEDSKVKWCENVSKPEHVAKIIIPVQSCLSPELDFFCENLSFNPWHSLPEHKPLGLVNRTRKTVYLRISELRHRLNRTSLEEPIGGEKFN